jgi:hypothetical protein
MPIDSRQSRIIRRFPSPLAMAGVLALSACAGGAAARPATPAPVAAPTDMAAQARATREACSALIEREDALELVDFSTFTRVAEGVWDAAVRVRRGGALTRLGCRYQLAVGRAELFDAAQPPALPAGVVPISPGPTGSAVAEQTPPPVAAAQLPAAPVPTKAPAPAPATSASPAGGTPGGAVTAPAAKRLAQDLSWVPDTIARANIARVRDGCLAEAKRRKLDIESIDSFQREAGSATVWEAALVSVRRGKPVTHACTFDQATGRTVLR